MKILLPIDESPFSTFAIQTIIQQTRPQNADVLLLHVVDILANLSMYDAAGPATGIHHIEEVRLSRAGEMVNEAAQTIRQAGFTVSVRVVRGEPKRTIVEVGNEWGADLIIIGSHGHRGVDRFLLGSVSEAVARYASCSVMILRSPELLSKNRTEKAGHKCAHPPCTCLVTSGKYCSAACEATATMPDIDCRCGHRDCAGRAH